MLRIHNKENLLVFVQFLGHVTEVSSGLGFGEGIEIFSNYYNGFSRKRGEWNDCLRPSFLVENIFVYEKD